MKLWKKDFEPNKEIEKFTVGNDYLLDQKLVKYDCLASIAHAKMLCKINVLNKDESGKLISGLNKIIKLHEKKEFKITPEDEDCHTAIENYLTKRYGDVGKKIHTARSRNDQVITATRLYEKAKLEDIKAIVGSYIDSLNTIVKKFGKVPLPGYTHMQKAMPTNISMWIGSFIESAKDNIDLIDAALKQIDKSPLGTAAGFGVPVFDIDRKMTAKLMGFNGIIENPMYVQLSRGKFESNIIHVLTQIMFDLNKLATDLILFSMKDFGYVSLPKEICTGSSIMPQKSNPDVLELIRARYHIVIAEEFKVKGIIGNLISGYNRDGQLTKQPLFESIDTTKDCLKMMILVIEKLKVNEDNCKKAMTDELYATEEAYKLVKKGMPFREAYKKIGEKYS